MLYPKENRAQKKLYYFCRGCSHEEDAKEAIIYRNELLHETE